MFNLKTYFSEIERNMFSDVNRIAALGIMVLLFLLWLVNFPEYFSDLNDRLKMINNLFSVVGLLFSTIAMLIAIKSFEKSSLRPSLRIQVTPYLQSENSVILVVDSNKKVTFGRPHNEWSILLWNHGKASGKYPMVMMEFKGPAFREDAFSGWKAVKHAHGRGYYAFQWIPGELTVVYPGFSIQLPMLYFGNHRIENDFEVEFKCVADGAKCKSLIIPVQVKCGENKGK